MIIKRFRLLGTQGLVGIALSAIDMALWDALARSHGTSLVQLLGGIEKPIPAYGAVGYDGVEGPAKVAEDWAKRGFSGIKAKIGYPTVREDVAVVRAMRKAVGDSVAIMVDYNQSLTPSEAVQCLRALDDTFGTSRNVGLKSGMRCKAEFKSDGGWYWVPAVARRINFFSTVNRMPLVFFGA